MSEILNVSDVVYSNKGIVQIPEQLSTQRSIHNTAKHLRWSVLLQE